jgi:hypothetical protein
MATEVLRTEMPRNYVGLAIVGNNIIPIPHTGKKADENLRKLQPRVQRNAHRLEIGTEGNLQTV